MGTGKSSFIDTFIPKGAVDRPVSGSNSMPVTTVTKEYPSSEEGIILMDTIGLDNISTEQGLPSEKIEGKWVHFIVLLSSLRWEQELAQTLEKIRWAKPGQNLTKWAAFQPTFKVSTSIDASQRESKLAPPPQTYLKGLASLRFGLVAERPLPPKSEPEKPKPIAEPAKSFPSSSVSSSFHRMSVAPQSAKPSKCKELFGDEEKQLAKESRALYTWWQSAGWLKSLPPQKRLNASDWKMLTSTQMKAYRQSGERLLEFHLSIMHGHINYAQNEGLISCLRGVPGLEDHVTRLYNEVSLAVGITKGKYADYVEALFHVLWSSKVNRAFIVDFLNTISSKGEHLAQEAAAQHTGAGAASSR